MMCYVGFQILEAFDVAGGARTLSTLLYSTGLPGTLLSRLITIEDIQFHTEHICASKPEPGPRNFSVVFSPLP